jgi:hypothetical protein
MLQAPKKQRKAPFPRPVPLLANSVTTTPADQQAMVVDEPVASTSLAHAVTLSQVCLFDQCITFYQHLQKPS